jgi:hypothetical protein
MVYHLSLRPVHVSFEARLMSRPLVPIFLQMSAQQKNSEQARAEVPDPDEEDWPDIHFCKSLDRRTVKRLGKRGP